MVLINETLKQKCVSYIKKKKKVKNRELNKIKSMFIILKVNFYKNDTYSV